ncbi:MAG: hypothetical protein EU536_02295 [Promethearchaeota archaeon]|nr:MAG: hypothetical protein EU536_02295 [Candidatus Lokiarchaeota archaeon]
MTESELKDEIERLKKTSKDYWNQKEEYKKKVKFLQDQIFKVLERHKFTTVLSMEKTYLLSKIVNEFISDAKDQLLIITPYMDVDYAGKLMDRASASPSLKIVIVTQEIHQIKDKEIQKAFKLLKAFDKIQHITNVFSNAFMIIKDKEKMLLASGGLTKEHLDNLYNIGLYSEETDDINLMVKIFKTHIPTFMEV